MAPLWSGCARAGFAPAAELVPSFYQAYYLVQDRQCACLTRYEPGVRRALDRVRSVLLEELPPLCVSLVQRREHDSAYLELLRGYLMAALDEAVAPQGRGGPARPLYTAPVHPAPAQPEREPGAPLPFVGGSNFRELGGYPADEGKRVRWGQIYRGIPTAKLVGPGDRARLDGLGLRLILDLRGTEEAAALPDYVPDGARLVRLCGLCDEEGREMSFAPADIARLLGGEPDTGFNAVQAVYRRMLTGNRAFRELFRALEAGETPILFHCSAGKDRTGMAAMLILLALGAPEQVIREDFARTNICRAAEIQAYCDEHAEEIARQPEREAYYRGVAGVYPEAAQFVLDTMRQDYGSPEAYLEAEYGLTPARLMRLRRMYLE